MESLEKPYDLFISYGRRDDDDFVEQLYEDLTKHGYKVWYDLESAESNGLSFLQNTRDALVDNPIRLILVVSPHALDSEFVKAEWQFALENCLVIIAVLRMGLERNKKGEAVASDKDYELIPGPLQKRRLHCIDFRSERNYQDGLSDLLFSLSKGVKNLATLHGVINKPNNYIEREQEIESVKEFILKDAYQPTVITSVGKAAAIQGMGGIGKSVIAAAICQDCDIRRSFMDGIYWVTIGQHPDMQKALQYVTKDNTINLRDKYEEARDKLRAFLKDKNCLIVLDDVWKQEHIEIFPHDSALRCRLLITTRNKQTVKHLSNNTFEIGLLNNEDALLLLANATGKKLEELPNEAVEIIKECGNLPLAISHISGMLKAGDENTWKHSLTMLQEADLEALSQKFPDYPYPNLFKAIDISINSLDDENRNKYLQLATFKEDTRIPEAIIHALWKTKGWKEYHTHQLLIDFVERSILQRVDDGIYSLHDLQFDYIRKTASDLRAVHQQLVNNLGDPLKLSHPYAWNNYIWHLKEAGKKETATSLLQNFDWMEAKLFASNINELIKDYEHFSLDENINLIYRALKLSAHVLAEDKNQLPAQLIGRLGYFENEPLGPLVEQAKMWKKVSWLRPVKPSLTPPGSLLGILKGHTHGIRSLLTDGNKIISTEWGPGNSIRIWEIESGRCLQTLQGRTRHIRSLLVHDNKIISGSYEGPIHVWEIESGQCLQTLQGHTWDVNLLLVHDDKIISGSEDKTIRIWEIDSGQCLQTLQGHANGIRSLLVHDNKIISGSADKTIRIWEIESGQCLQVLHGHTGEITSLFVHDNKIISGSSDSTIRIWEIVSGQCLHTLSGDMYKIDSLLVYNNEIICASSDKDNLLQLYTGNILFWEIESGRCLQTIKSGVSSLWVHENKIIRDFQNDILIWDIPSGQCLQTLRGHAERITSLLVHDNKIVSGSADKTIRIWEIESGRCLQTPQGHTHIVTALLVHENKIISGSDDNTIRIWEIKPSQPPEIRQGHTNEITTLVAKRNKIISGSVDKTIRIWEIESGECLQKLQNTNSIFSLSVHDNKIISESYDGTIHIWEMESGQCLQTLQGQFNWISSLLVHDNKIISGSTDKTIHIWEIESGQCLQTLKGHTERIWFLLVHYNKIISCSDDNTICVWEIKSGRCLQTLQGHTWYIRSLLVHDSKIVSGSWDCTIRIWEIESGQCLQTLEGHTSAIRSLLVHDNKIISGSEDSTIRIWEIDSGQCLQTLQGHTDIICQLLIHDNKIISGSLDRTIRIWEIASGQCLQILHGHTGEITSLLIKDNKLISTDSSGLLIVYDAKMFIQIFRYYSDAEYMRDFFLLTKILFKNNRIICGDRSGQLHILEMIEV